MKAHGAEVCVRGGKVEVLEGDWTPQRVVMLKFPSVEQAKAFYDSAEYGKARKPGAQGADRMTVDMIAGRGCRDCPV